MDGVTAPSDPRDPAGPIADLAHLVAGGGVLVLSGAGLSTESGIPDYRGVSGAQRRYAPMTFQAFTRDVESRRRYWARSHLGWRSIARAVPNEGHRAVAALQDTGLLTGIVTQNVDGLHQAASARDVVELHGNLDRVICLRCGDTTGREHLDYRLREANPRWAATASAPRPDGDAELADADLAGFHVVDCVVCRGVLKPDVVFFGESVPPARVAACFALLEQARVLLVLGSSLTVMSGRRFVLRAAQAGIPVAVVNRGPTRADPYAGLVLDESLGDVLPRLARLLEASVAGRPSPSC